MTRKRALKKPDFINQEQLQSILKTLPDGEVTRNKFEAALQVELVSCVARAISAVVNGYEERQEGQKEAANELRGDPSD